MQNNFKKVRIQPRIRNPVELAILCHTSKLSYQSIPVPI